MSEEQGSCDSFNDDENNLEDEKSSSILDRIPNSGSVIEYHGCGTSTSCGYCKDKNTYINERNCRKSYDMKAIRLTALDYQLLLDRNWRRSGNYCYHPINVYTCCPNYAISCKALKFKLRGSKRRCIENLNSFLIKGHKNTRVNLNYEASDSSLQNKLINYSSKINGKTYEQLKESPKLRDKRFVKSCERKMKLHNFSQEDAISSTKFRHRKQDKYHIKKEISLESYLFPLKSALTENLQNQSSSSSSFNPKHNLEIRMLHVDSEASKLLRDEEHKLIEKYQLAIHKEDKDEWCMSRFCSFLVTSPLISEQIKNFDYIEKTGNINNDELSVDVNDSNNYLLVKPPKLPTHFGTYHCTYHLDGKLIAVGVLDILPKCITTVYFFYDPAYQFLNLGIYSALVEISMIRQMNDHFITNTTTLNGRNNELVNYYMGFYVHESKKMRYKTSFKPSYLLCSETFQYIPLDDCLHKLRDRKYARFSSAPNEMNFHNYRSTFEECNEIPVIVSVVDNYKMGDYLNWLTRNLGQAYTNVLLENVLLQYVRLLTPELAKRIYFIAEPLHNAIVKLYIEREGKSPQFKNKTKKVIL